MLLLGVIQSMKQIGRIFLVHPGSSFWVR
jgi:hypothetical protein